MPSLTSHDLSILEKIKDPEAGPSAPLLIDDSSPKDPHITDAAAYSFVSDREREIILSIQSIELEITGLKPPTCQSPLAEYLRCIQDLDDLIGKYPKYASARNNRAQALRRVYGDGILVILPQNETSKDTVALDPLPEDDTLLLASKTILADLSTAINLLTPNPFSAISPQAAKTLSQAYTQRGAFYHLTAKRLNLEDARLRIDSSIMEAHWKTIDFEEHASRDFMIGGRYGNEIAKALAVSVNPTAKLCGDMVREAMRKEYIAAT